MTNSPEYQRVREGIACAACESELCWEHKPDMTGDVCKEYLQVADRILAIKGVRIEAGKDDDAAVEALFEALLAEFNIGSAPKDVGARTEGLRLAERLACVLPKSN